MALKDDNLTNFTCQQKKSQKDQYVKSKDFDLGIDNFNTSKACMQLTQYKFPDQTRMCKPLGIYHYKTHS